MTLSRRANRLRDSAEGASLARLNMRAIEAEATPNSALANIPTITQISPIEIVVWMIHWRPSFY